MYTTAPPVTNFTHGVGLLAAIDATTPTGSIEQLFGYGVLGVWMVLMLLGWLAPKWVLDEYRTREKFLNDIIERQAAAIERLADKIEAKAA